MSAAPSLLRQLAERHDYAALLEACTAHGGAEATILAALAQANLGNPAAARANIAALDPGSLTVEARVDLAAVQQALGDVAVAAAELEAAAVHHADHPLLLARLAGCRLQQGRKDEAVALFERSLSGQPHILVYLSLLGLYQEQARLDALVSGLEAARAHWAEDRDSWPEDQQQSIERRLRALELERSLAMEPMARTEAWIEQQRACLDPADWCALLSVLARGLAARDRHHEAEEWLRVGLRRFPEQVQLHGQLAELAALQGRTAQAIALLRRAAGLAAAQGEDTVPLWCRLSALALQHNPAVAQAAAEAARNALDERPAPRDPNSEALVELAVAGVEAQGQQLEDAERRYRRLLTCRPDLVPAMQGLGQLLMQLGRIDEAAAWFERIRDIDPARGASALINVRRLPRDDETLARLEALARTPGLEGSVHTGLLFQLANAREQRGEFDAAFALAREANRASRRLLRYDPRAHRQYCARIRHAFPRALYQHRANCGHESTLPVFVVGMPRSGTTLVEQILAGHSRIHGAGELGTMPRVIAGLERWERQTGSGRHYPDCVDDLDAAVVRGVAESVLTELRDYAPGAAHVVDKLPHNFENVGLIRLLFPRARIVSARRDPRDIAVSNYFLDFAARHGGLGFSYDLEWIGEQLADHNLLMHHWQQVFGAGNILEVRYEDVVDDPEAAARRLLDYVGVEWEPGVLDFAALERPVRTASQWQVRQPLYRSSKARWQHYRDHLQPLIAGTNRKITAEPVEMVTLPEPGWLNTGVDAFRAGDLDGAERCFRQLLAHLPEHAAARFMLGLVCLQKGHPGDGIALLEQALQRCPWNPRWRADLVRAYRMAGRHQDAADLAAAAPGTGAPDAAHVADPQTGAPSLDFLFLSGESTCPSFGIARSGPNC